MTHEKCQKLIESAYAKQGPSIDSETLDAIKEVVRCLTLGILRVANRNPQGIWTVHEWIKMGILLYFKSHKSQAIESGDLHFFDKIPVQKWTSERNVRVVPPAIVREGAHVEPGTILMPSFVNIGAYVGSGTMVDTWATVGSCAQIGRNVHLSGGVGIGGVLEPPQASPVIIEDDCFLGSRSIVVEGVLLEEGAVLGAGVVLTSSTNIIDVSQSKAVTYKGRIPKNSVVIPGHVSKKFPAGEFGVPCALIIGQRKESTDKKTSLNQVLRDYAISV